MINMESINADKNEFTITYYLPGNKTAVSFVTPEGKGWCLHSMQSMPEGETIRAAMYFLWYRPKGFVKYGNDSGREKEMLDSGGVTAYGAPDPKDEESLEQKKLVATEIADLLDIEAKKVGVLSLYVRKGMEEAAEFVRRIY